MIRTRPTNSFVKFIYVYGVKKRSLYSIIAEKRKNYLMENYSVPKNILYTKSPFG